MLCDAAEAADGKLFILGGGWNVTGPDPRPSAVAILIDVPWDQANQRHPFTLSLLTEDGQQVLQQGPEGPQPVVVEAFVEVGRPPGTPPGTPLTVPFAINIGPLGLAQGARYVWALTLAGETREEWRLPFSVRAPAAPSGPISPTSF